jgi:uncharacterized protein YbjT (DUF2867 family)
MAETVVITGAFSYTGSAVAKSLLARGVSVRTLTNRSSRVHDPGPGIETFPLQFRNPAQIQQAMRGAQIFVNTYWVRYPYVGVSFDDAVGNTDLLFKAAQAAGVERIVHVSVSNASLDSPLGYYRGKARAEESLRRVGVSYAIVRPTLIVGPKDILVDNIAWFLRRFPLFALPGTGLYRLQPVTLDDVGEIIADAALSRENVTVDAAGPEIMTFRELVEAIASAVGRRPPIVKTPPWLSMALIRVIGWLVGEVILSRQELQGLVTELLVSREPPRGVHSVRQWLQDHGDELGRSYVSEFARHVRTG